jgi:hypothetical protein
MASNENLDRAARELYEPRYLHWPGCGQLLNFEQVLDARAHGEPCPYCGKLTTVGLAPDVTPERADQMMLELLERRQALGLDAVP